MVFRGAYLLPLGYSLNGLAIALLVTYLVQRPGTWPGRVLNSRPAKHLGALSYSLDIWQQVFIFGVRVASPLDLLFGFIAAEGHFTPSSGGC